MGTEVSDPPRSRRYAESVQTPGQQRQRRREEQPDRRAEVVGLRRQPTRPSRRLAAYRWVAFGAILMIAALLGAELTGQAAAGWIVGLVVGLTTVILVSLVSSSLR